MNKLLILIPNYKGGGFIRETITPLKQGIANSTVLVVDDASPDDPKSYLNGVADHCIYKSSNGGYAPTVNVGLRYFLDNEEFDLVMITNSDIKVDVAKAQSISAAILEYMEDREVGVLGFLEGSDSNAEFYESINISGFLFILTRAVVEKVGLLDEGFYMYGEEQDYFSRVRDANYKLVQSRVVVEHEAEGSGTSSLKNSWFAIRNSLLLEFKSKKIKNIIRKIAALFALVNRLYKPKNTSDPSYIRVTRPGFLVGNILLVGSILWNLWNFILGKNNV
tara:strand:- start:844 stop:1677 length:834 start_codon:yes stop_codon:yes gene_type:complete